ncbi:MAG: P-II family nitrogen regulator [Thiotrichales bacterium]|jgi:nitrogen regulatory protein PII|nr:P-II family nitrogen regulator [Thiotrichales bacterium]MBT3613379.1 P-II family nitrogen regulator [Thiotrichales bacterium]MBT4260943.1 P-II family nitrogen regulator [Thiotrichales bacterium]MBT4574248.1 P-II family nitrogen regulator [Thiotrichales bacterium]MBT4971952.1 P-II family nitrogen regulator [Thiotrichales bacterium]
MSARNITVLTGVSLITCIVQRGNADAVIKASREAGAQGATVNYAKGTGIRERMGVMGVAVEVDKEIIQVIVSSEQEELIFEQMYLAGKLDTPGMGIMYTTPLDKAATYIPAEVLDKVA